MDTLTPSSRDPTAWPLPRLQAWPGGAREHHVIVVGAGIGGLSAAALLALRGCKVLVIEAHDRPGGCCSCWTLKVRGRDRKVGRFVFDAGVQDISGLGAKGPLRWLLRTLGVEDRIEWRRVLHRYVQDGLCLDVPEDADELIRRLRRFFPGDAAGIQALFGEIEAVYHDLYAEADLTGGVPVRPASLDESLAWSARHPRAARWLQQPFAKMLDAYVQDPRLKELLTTITEYISDKPESLTMAEAAPLYGYYFEGGYYPAGGSQRLADVLRAVIEEHGGEVRLRTRVSQILMENGRAAGILTAAGDRRRAAIVIANADVVASLTGLLHPFPLQGRYAQRLRRLRRGPSAILLSLAVDFLPDLPARVFVKAGDLHFGIGNPSVIDPSLAPPGYAVMTVMRLLAEEEAHEWFAIAKDKAAYRSAKNTFADRLVAAIESTVMPGLSQRILYRQVAAPPTFTRYTQAGNGGIYGAARGQWSPSARTPAPGLLLAGAGLENGPGIEAVVISGVRAANLIRPA